ncbi:DUF4271 domain-containing protein [Pedobacter insulae]|uniref:DUF4271 domain-containing protein n=1 Tax=Pedobacter insulae TaxID=414048 RepID=A0A1I2TGA8_9SPHI|nr:DUF4271 domain-containing protein [Pedobacter insulae]SFG63925.1 protein of unknown function [Pedobacter insulae]
MYQKLILFLLLGHYTFAQQPGVDSLTQKIKLDARYLDTAIIQQQSVRDTVAPVLLRTLDSLQRVQYDDSVRRTFGFPFFNLQDAVKNYKRADQIPQYQEGKPIERRDLWIVASIAFLLILFAVLKNFFDKQLTLLVQSFFSNRILANVNKEENLFTSWQFLLLFIHFGFTIGLFFYLVGRHKELSFVKDGFSAFISISIAILILYALKIVVLKMLGFFFKVQKPINEYVSILYLTYFNASFLFMPLVIAFALSPAPYGKFYMATAIVLLLIIFVFQMIRAGFTILSQNRFSKVYLLLYFCTLEICPILILIKAIGF